MKLTTVLMTLAVGLSGQIAFGQTIQACRNNTDDTLRQVTSSDECRVNETYETSNAQGPAGTREASSPLDHLKRTLATVVHPKDRNWQIGILVDLRTVTAPTTILAIPVPPDYIQRSRVVYATDEVYVISSNGYSYVARERIQGPVSATINRLIVIAIEGNRLYLMDEHGKQHTAIIEKTTLEKEAANPPEASR